MVPRSFARVGLSDETAARGLDAGEPTSSRLLRCTSAVLVVWMTGDFPRITRARQTAERLAIQSDLRGTLY